ncbi:MAG: fatty acid--CoA ligase [Desulfarculus sp.]|nr:MAG: fatty acid--CoA ligase [Desulfarculus sp.]
MKQTRLTARTPEAYPFPLLIKQLWNTPLHFAPEQEIVYRDLRRLTYRELYGRIHRLAGALNALGVGPGDVVAVLDWDSHRYLEAFFAVPMLGAVLHTVNIRLSPEQVLFTMNHAQDKVVLAHEEFLPLLAELQGRLSTVQKFVLLQDGPQAPATSLPIAAEYEDMLARAPEHFAFADFDENSMATIFYTTGTTGDPKGVYYSHRQLVLHTLAVGWTMGGFQQGVLQSRDVYMPVTPMFHVHAWGIPYVATVLGVKQVYPGRYEPEVLLRLVDREKVTFSHCVPTILHMLVNHPLARELDLSGWTVNLGGAALPRGLARDAEALGIRVFVGYGMSETCPVLTVGVLKPHMLNWERERQLDYQLTAGFPIPLVDLRVVDPEGRELTRDGRSAGEVVARAPWLTQGYFNNPEGSQALWAGGWLHTGDIGSLNPEGYLQISDRLKDVIKSGGEWVSSLELESLLSQHPAISEAAVIAIPDAKWGERPGALVVLDPVQQGKVSAEEIQKFLARFVDQGRISKWAVPRTVLFVQAIPKTSVGKIDKKRIRRELTSET